MFNKITVSLTYAVNQDVISSFTFQDMTYYQRCTAVSFMVSYCVGYVIVYL